MSYFARQSPQHVVAGLQNRVMFDELLVDPDTEDFLEYLPVEDWFDKYLEQLHTVEDGNRAGGMNKGARVEIRVNSDDNSFEDETQSNSAGSPTGGAQPASPPAAALAGAGPNGSAGYPTVVTTGVSSGDQTGSPPVVGSPPSSGGGGGGGGGAVVISGVPEQLPDRKPAPGEKPKRRRVRDARQQELNKLAQVRYRERKRAKAEQLKGEIGGLSQELSKLQVAQKENSVLQDQQKFLEDQLRRKEEEIARVRAQLSERGSGEDSEGGRDAASGPLAAAAGSGGGSVPWDTPEDLDQLVQDWLKRTSEIKELIDLIGLGDNCSPYGNMIKHVWSFDSFSRDTRLLYQNAVARLDILVHDVMELCIRVLRLQGAQIEQLMNADYKMVCSLGAGWKEEKKWLHAAKSLNFSREQRDKILEARKSMLAKLDRIYAERRQLNLLVVQQLLPTVYAEAPDPSQPQALDAATMKILDQLESNLRDEQRALSEQDYITFKQLLTPIQGGLFVTLSFPDHCDCLALLNAVDQIYGSGFQPQQAAAKA